MPDAVPLSARLAAALAPRQPLLAAPHESAVRLFNGFLEGQPDLVAEVYADTLVLLNHARPADSAAAALEEAQRFYLGQLPWLRTVVVKSRYALPLDRCFTRNGVVTHGDAPAREIREHGVRYAVDLLLNQDTSFYPDTRLLRRWTLDRLAGARVLNTFAYTGSLGVAALAAGAKRLVQLDRTRGFLDLARASHALNAHPTTPDTFWAGDFFAAVARLKRDRAHFDCIFLDPPFFSTSAQGTVNLVTESRRLINKVRPLLADGGRLVAVNNALFLPGADYLRTLEELCADGYLAVEELIPVPADCIGFPETRTRPLPADPAPFNHATKIAVLRAKRKTAAPPVPAGAPPR
ncbi:MAG TPA: class I SAM-dependent methyltransferase [Opitutaceae bacterium]|nr:class I SAM-dependent methyltransferase [Opitutaceae bacterium]